MTRPSSLPHLADATDLERWADRVDARYQLAHLLRRLVRAENDQVQRVEMRAGEGAGMRGYDGTVEATRRTSFVPDGLSVWEMGVGEDPAKKANADYRTRTKNSLGVDKATATFVFVTPRRWDNKSSWAAKKRAQGKWKDVLALDADDIEAALDEAPAVHYWFSEMLGMPAAEVQTLEMWWEKFSAVYEPRLTPQMVLAGRADEAASLLRLLARDTGRTFIRAASVDDGLAFASAVMLLAGPDQSSALLSKSLLVHDGASLRRLDATSKLLILLPYEEKLRREAEVIANHHVVCIVTDGGDCDIDLPPLEHRAFQSELRKAGVLEPELTNLARAAHKSLVALRRVSNRTGSIAPETWSSHLDKAPIRRAWLAGSWNSARSGDVDVLSDLCGESFEALDQQLSRISREPDPLFSAVGSTWAVTSRIDSWPSVRVVISDADLISFESAVQVVLSSVDPRLDLPPRERWSAAIYGKVRVHSDDLRRGVARTLALLGSRGDEVRLASGRTGRSWAESVAARLMERANGDSSGQVWASLEDVLPLVAEAAPDVFLRAVDIGTTGSDPVLRTMFQDQEADGFSISSPHTGLLWALETVAWSAAYLGFAADVLCTLAELDPGGRLSNRPKSSLSEIFRPWHPQTSASAEARLRTLDAMLRRHPTVAWDVLVSLLPRGHDVGLNTHRPEFRDWAPGEDLGVSRRDYVMFVEAVARRLLASTEEDPSRWVQLVPALGQLPPDALEVAVASLEHLDTDVLSADEQSGLWGALDHLVREHRQFVDADWSLPESVLSRIGTVAQRFQPASPITVNRWLFDDWHPDLGVRQSEDFEAYDALLTTARVRAVAEVLRGDNLRAVLELAVEVELPWAVGDALAQVDDFEAEADVVELLNNSDSKVLQFAHAFAKRRALVDPSWALDWLAAKPAKPAVQARLLQAVNDLPVAWQKARDLGDEVESIYWREFVPYGRGSNFYSVGDAAAELIKHGRVAAAIGALSMYVDRMGDAIDRDVVIAALRSFGSEPDPEVRQVSASDLSRLLDFLRSRGEPDELIASFEWKFLPLLHHEGRTPALERLLATHPNEFVELVKLVFRPASERGEPKQKADDTARYLATNAFRLLRGWKTIPGTLEDGTVDPAVLRQWLEDARRLLAGADRSEVGELQVGEVLAHSPADADGTFPTLAVREALEEAPTDHLARGFAVGLFNKRGVTSRGLDEGGDKDFALARQYDEWAARIEGTHPRTAGVLRSVADGYRAEGRRNEEEAKKFLEGFDL